MAGLISIHAPREGSDHLAETTLLLQSTFLSTLPARGATCRSPGSAAAPNFYPRSPRGERQSPGGTMPGQVYFYPRSPRGERL